MHPTLSFMRMPLYAAVYVNNSWVTEVFENHTETILRALL